MAKSFERFQKELEDQIIDDFVNHAKSRSAGNNIPKIPKSKTGFGFSDLF